MALFKRHPADTLYRGAILLGCLAFLLGVSGIFYFRHIERRDLPEADAASVLVHGVTNDPGIEVIARWVLPPADGARGKPLIPEEAAYRTEAGRLDGAPGVYTFRRAPAGIPIELIVYRNDRRGRAELHRQLAILTYGQSIYTAVPQAPR